MDLGIKLENGIIKTIAYREPIFRRQIGVSFKPIMIAKSLEDGLSDLVKSAQEEEQEACWMYMHDNSRWYNLASEPTDRIDKLGNMRSGTVNGYLPLYLGDKQKTHYHTHTKRFIEQNVEDELKEAMLRHNGDELEILNKMLRKCHFLDAIFPSDTDIGNYKSHNERRKNSNMDFGIVSPEFFAQIEIDAAEISPKAEQEYVELLKKMPRETITGLGVDAWINIPLIELAQEYCKKLNAGIPGLSIKIRKH